MTIYIVLLLGSLFVPLILSFDKKLQFYKQWNTLIPSIIIVSIWYISFDILFTKIGIWGFNPRYLSPIFIFGLPLEEWLFFIIIPYASIFLHDSIVLYFSKFKLNDRFAKILTLILIILSILMVAFNFNKTYTSYIFILMTAVLVISYFDKAKVINKFYLTFLVILIPFVLVNAVLTGSFIEEPIVWYNHSENLGIRFLTIPIEDSVYGFSLILFSLLLREKLKTLFNKPKQD